MSLTFEGGHLESFPQSGWRKLAVAETRLLATGIALHLTVLTRLGLTHWRLTLGVQLPQCGYMGIVQLSGPTAALWATIAATVYTANTMASTVTMNHTHEPDLCQFPFSRSRILVG